MRSVSRRPSSVSLARRAFQVGFAHGSSQLGFQGFLDRLLTSLKELEALSCGSKISLGPVPGCSGLLACRFQGGPPSFHLLPCSLPFRLFTFEGSDTPTQPSQSFISFRRCLFERSLALLQPNQL